MTLLLFLIVLWVALTGELSLENLGVGLVLGLILLVAGGRAMDIQYFQLPTDRPLIRLWRTIKFLGFFVVQLMIAGFSVFIFILKPDGLRPGVVAVPLDLTSNVEITLLANLITLTPGTLTLEVFTDQNLIYVHTVYLDNPDDFRAGIKNGFERRIKELFAP